MFRDISEMSDERRNEWNKSVDERPMYGYEDGVKRARNNIRFSVE